VCGIAGIYRYNRITQPDIELVSALNDIQRHRGPDDEGLFISNSCVLGHRRLAIIDLSSDGHQPFVSDDGRFQIVYNGEIYNYIELREELKKLGWQFRTKTDTEVLLKAYQQFGEGCLPKFNGMFSFAVYDTENKNLFLARDRVGVKPLYYTIIDSGFYFASEIKALCQIPALQLSLNYQSLFDYIVFNRTDIFDETFFAYKEDVDLAWRAQLFGWKSVYTPEALAFHLRTFKPGQRQGLSKEVRLHSVKNRYLLLIKNELGYTFIRHAFYIIFYDLKIVIYLLLFEQSSLPGLYQAIRLLPQALRWRKFIMARKKVAGPYMLAWMK